MTVTKKAEEAASVEQNTEITALIAKIEEFLSTQNKSQGLTPEVRAALAAPLDARHLKTRKGPGGKVFTYAEVDYLESRATEVDPGWSQHIDATTPNVIVCETTICGVTRPATAGYYIPDEYEVWDNNKKQMVPRLMTAEVSHTIVTRAEAAAKRRSFAAFQLGAELWAHNQEEAADFIPTEDSPRQQKDFRAPSDGRINMLVDFGVPKSIATRINAWGRGKGSDGYPISDVSETIKALMDKRPKGERGALDRRTWEAVVKQYAPYALNAEVSDDDEDDDF